MDERVEIAQRHIESFGSEVGTPVPGSRTLARTLIAALEAEGVYVGRLEQVGETCLTCGRVGTPDDCGCGFDANNLPVFRKVVSSGATADVHETREVVVSGDENSGCDKRCSEMHTYEPPCELAAPMPNAAGMRLAGDANSGEPKPHYVAAHNFDNGEAAILNARPAGEVGDATP